MFLYFFSCKAIRAASNLRIKSLSLSGTSELSLCNVEARSFTLCADLLNATVALAAGTNMPFRSQNVFQRPIASSLQYTETEITSNSRVFVHVYL